MKGLRPWQVEPVASLVELLRSGQNAVDASDTGTGKTYTACAVSSALRLPTLVVCPKIACSQWCEAAAHFGDSVSVIGWEALRTGKTPYGAWQFPPPAEKQEFFVCTICLCKVDVTNMLPCHCHHSGIHCVQAKKKAHRYGRFSFHPAVKLLIADEVHKASGLDSLNADMLIAARRQGIPTLGLSATLGSSPLHFRAIGYLLGLHRLENYYTWAYSFGVRRDPAFHGLHWPVSEAAQAGAMRSIHAKIFPSRGVRVRKADIPGFPEVDITAELYDLGNEAALEAIYAEMADSLRTLADRAARDVAPDSAITIQLRAQQKIELYKVPLFVELTNEYLEKGFSMGIFVNFRQTIHALSERLKTSCIIDGSPELAKHRQANITAFQSNQSRVVLVNNAAGGIALSLQDLDGNFPRGGLVSPGFSAVVLRQLLGRFCRDGGKSKSFYRIVLAAKTIETKIHKTLKSKLQNLDCLLDSDLLPTTQ